MSERMMIGGVAYQVEGVGLRLMLNGREVDYLVDHDDRRIRLSTVGGHGLEQLRAAAIIAAAQTMPTKANGRRVCSPAGRRVSSECRRSVGIEGERVMVFSPARPGRVGLKQGARVDLHQLRGNGEALERGQLVGYRLRATGRVDVGRLVELGRSKLVVSVGRREVWLDRKDLDGLYRAGSVFYPVR